MVIELKISALLSFKLKLVTSSSGVLDITFLCCKSLYRHHYRIDEKSNGEQYYP